MFRAPLLDAASALRAMVASCPRPVAFRSFFYGYFAPAREALDLT
jgi:hypothetical protein